MYATPSPSKARTPPKALARLLAAAALLLAAAAPGGAADCQPVNGHYTERAALGPGCPSLVGVCIEGTYSGVLRGDVSTVVRTFAPAEDPPVTSVFLFTAESVIHAHLAGREGDLWIRNAGAVRATGAGEIVDLQVVVGGTGDLADATGTLQTTGTFTFEAGGRSEYTGVVCVP